MTTLKKLSLVLLFSATALPMLANNPILEKINQKMPITKDPEFLSGTAIFAGGKCITNSIPKEQMGYLKNKLCKYSGRSIMLVGLGFIAHSINRATADKIIKFK